MELFIQLQGFYYLLILFFNIIDAIRLILIPDNANYKIIKFYSDMQFSPSCLHADLSTSPAFLFQPKSISVYSPCFQKSYALCFIPTWFFKRLYPPQSAGFALNLDEPTILQESPLPVGSAIHSSVRHGLVYCIGYINKHLEGGAFYVRDVEHPPFASYQD